MKFQVKTILQITGGRLLRGKDISGDYFISTDTRTITPEEIFMPLSGENFDGHDFINAALSRGIKGYLIDKKHQECVFEGADFVIEVEDTLTAYLQIANHARNQIDPVVVAVTGSSGKTTTKEMIYSVLSQQYRTHKSKLNHNNEIGLCQTMLSMPENTEFLVVEMGMRGLGEIELLSKYANPDIAVITNIGTAHIGRLKSRENIAKAKCEITKHLKPEGILIAYDDEIVRKNLNWKGKTTFYSIKNTTINKINPDFSEFMFNDKIYKLNVSGEYNIINALAAINVGLSAQMHFTNIADGLSAYSPIDNRWQVLECQNGAKVINDSYNANPDSVKAAVKAVVDSYRNNKITLVLGDMAELGNYEEILHQEVGNYLKDLPIYELVTVGEKAKIIAKCLESTNLKIKSFTRNDEVVKYLMDTITSESVVLLKASRCMSFEKIIENLNNLGVSQC